MIINQRVMDRGILFHVMDGMIMSISRFMEVGTREMNRDFVDVEFLDISNLYLPSNVIKHKAKVLVNNIYDYVPDTVDKRNSIISFLNEILKKVKKFGITWDII